MNHSYLFESARLGFRPVMHTDLNYLLALADADPKYWSESPGKLTSKIKKDIQFFNQNGYGPFLVFDLKSNDFMGRTGFADFEDKVDGAHEVEVGYVVLEKYRGQGYATEMLQAVLVWAGDNIQKDKIIAIAEVGHTASEKIMQKVGMVFSRRAWIDGEDSVVYEYLLSH